MLFANLVADVVEAIINTCTYTRAIKRSYEFVKTSIRIY